MSTFAEKMVDFEISVENESKAASLPSKQGTSPEQTSALEESILKVSRDLSTINRNQKYFRTRENRNMSTVKSTENRIFNFSVMESLLMISMAGLQVFIVRFFFQGARKEIDWIPSCCDEEGAAILLYRVATLPACLFRIDATVLLKQYDAAGMRALVLPKETLHVQSWNIFANGMSNDESTGVPLFVTLEHQKRNNHSNQDMCLFSKSEIRTPGPPAHQPHYDIDSADHFSVISN
ncbi:MAG: hypothetical protein Q9176_003659 [Flavoplaca citrina]